MLLKRKKLVCNSFQPDIHYCIEGALNQLLWDVENAIFITISNSSQIFFDSGQLLFQVKEGQSKFQLTAYGLNCKKKVTTQIKIVSLEKHDFNEAVTQTKSIALHFQKTIKSSNISLKRIENRSISFQKPLLPREYKKIQIDFKHLNFFDTNSAKLFDTNSIQDINNLREVIESNFDNT